MPDTTYPIRVGVQLCPQHTSYEDYARMVHLADELGIDTLWDWDHFFPLEGNPSGNHFEGWTLLTAMALLTKRARIGCLVTCNSYRNPALLSDMAKTVDHISGGRLILGIGAGWFERDYTEYGYDFAPPGRRVAALEQSLALIQRRWEIDVPRPIQQPIPILIGATGPKMLRLVAKYANMWHDFGDAEAIAHKIAPLNEWCKKEGRDLKEIEICGETHIDSSDTDRDALLKEGVTHLIMEMNAPWDVSAIEKLIRWRDCRRG